MGMNREEAIEYLKRKKERNDTIWYARFYFSKIPKKGFLEAKYL